LIPLTGENTVTAKSLGGPYSDADIGIVKYHFELGVGENTSLGNEKSLCDIYRKRELRTLRSTPLLPARTKFEQHKQYM